VFAVKLEMLRKQVGGNAQHALPSDEPNVYITMPASWTYQKNIVHAIR